MSACKLCPRACGADRTIEAGACGTRALPRVAMADLHFYEEPCISGSRGSGAIFFSGCNMRCVFCQNHEISARLCGTETGAAALAAIMLSLQERGAHNINLVTGAPHSHILAEAIARAKGTGLSIPIVYNTNAYETVEALRLLDGLVDIYLPDLKYTSSAAAARYSGTPDYFAYAAPAVMEMQRQAGTLCIGEDGLAQRGMIIRHLVLPGSVGEARSVLSFIADNLPRETYISLMGQYCPCHKAGEFPPLNRRLLQREYDRAVDFAISLGLLHVFIQSLDSAQSEYTPDFKKFMNKL